MTATLTLHHLIYRDHNLTLSADQHLSNGRYGLTGANGSGKSTLLQLLCGLRTPTSGRIRHQGSLLYLPQQAHQPIADQLQLRPLLADPAHPLHAAISRRLLPLLQQQLRGRLPPDLCSSNLLSWLDAHEFRLSGGEQQKLRLCLCFALQPDILLLDEPGNDLDTAAQLWLQQHLQRFSGLLIVVSHQPALLSSLQQMLWLQDGQLQRHNGSYEQLLHWQEQQRQDARRAHDDSQKALQQVTRQQQENREKAQQRAQSGKRDRRRKSQGKALLDFNAEQASHSRGAQNRQLQRQLEQARQQHDQERSRWRNWQTTDLRWPDVRPRLTAGVLIQASGLRLPLGQTHALSLQVSQHQHWHIRGHNGSGKSTLLRVLSGDLPPLSGDLSRRGPVLRLNQQALQPDDDQPLLVWLQSHCPQAHQTDLRQWLAMSGLPPAQHRQSLATLSGGERMKAALLALWCSQPGALLLLDEPDNHLDQPARQTLQQALQQWPGAWLLVSHDDAFAAGCGITHSLTLAPAED